MIDIDGFDRAAYLHDNAEPPDGIELPDCEECGGEAEVDYEKCGCLRWRCIAGDDEGHRACDASGIIDSCRDCARGEE